MYKALFDQRLSPATHLLKQSKHHHLGEESLCSEVPALEIQNYISAIPDCFPLLYDDVELSCDLQAFFQLDMVLLEVPAKSASSMLSPAA